jgi:peptidoglycan/LPS O-acetylase OafA/YrhL
MSHWKTRLLGTALILFFAGMTYYNWGQLHGEGRYSPKMAACGPLGVVGGLFVLLFPSKGGKPETAGDKFIVLLVFAFGAAAGLLNLYLMDPGLFGR